MPRDVADLSHLKSGLVRFKGGLSGAQELLVDFGFLSVNRKEKELLKGIGHHLEIVGETVAAFRACVDSAAKGDADSVEKQIARVFEEETSADDVHRDLSLKVASGAFFGGIREDMLDLLERIDSIADSAKDAARVLSSDSRLQKEAREVLGSEKMRLFLGDLKSSVGALTELVRALEKGRREVLPRVHTVEDFEELADSHKDEILRELFGSGESMDPVSVIQLRDFVFMADNIADNAEDASDVILVLVAKGYG